MRRPFSFALVLVAGLASAHVARAESGSVQVAQAQPGPPIQTPAGATPLPAAPAPAAAAAPDTPEEPIGNVASLTGKASVKRNDKSIPLALKDDIYLNDVVQTAASSTLGITFSDGTTFNLKASSQITIDDFVYEEGGKKNAGVFDVARGTVAFVAAQVAKTGDMQITTPTATLGIRGTSGLVEVPAGTTATSAGNVNIKLYPDADGRVGRIEVNDRAGARLGFLSQGASGFAIRPGAGGARFAAVPIAITPQMMQRDQGFVRQVHAMQTFGRRVFDEQRAFRRANPGVLNPNRPIRQPGQLRGPDRMRRDGLPGQNRPGTPQQPGLQNRPGQQPPGAPGRQGLRQPGSPQQSGQPGQIGRPGRQQQGQPGQQAGQPPGGPQRPGLSPRPGQNPGAPGQVGSPTGAPPQGAPVGRPVPGGPAGTPPVNQRLQQPGGVPPQPQQGGQFRQGGAPGLRQPGLPGRPALQHPQRAAPVQAPPKGRKRTNELR